MRRAVHCAIAVAVFGILLVKPGSAQEHPNPGLSRGDLRLSVVGIGTADYEKSLNFYTKVMGFQPAFSFSPNGKTTNTYLQLSRDTFLELQEAPANTPPRLTHIHMQTEDVDASVARLRKAGVAACSEALKTGCMIDPRIAQPTQEKSATIVDPSGIRIEPTQFIPGSLTRKAVNSWDSQSPSTKLSGTRLMVVGIAVKDYPESQNFYEKLMGFPVAFKFSSPDGHRTTTYYQISRYTFLEMQSATADVPPGLTHVHIVTEDLNATIARLRQAGLASVPRNATTPNTVSEAGVTQPSNVKSANVFDPNGIRLELNELLPESLTKKAMESWK
jgi:catechol 2,3-dioxygenase-like lactoylglutathione lyase family enzyme